MNRLIRHFALFNLLSFALLACAQESGGGTTTAEVDPAVRCYVNAVNAEDLDALVGCFAPDGLIMDVNREISGSDAIRAWADGEVIGGTLEVLEVEATDAGQRLLVHWAPAGSNGWRAYYIHLRGSGRAYRVSRLAVRLKRHRVQNATLCTWRLI